MSNQPNLPIKQCLLAVWRRTQRKHACSGLLAFFRWFVPLFLVILVVDRFAFLPGGIRALAALVLLAVSMHQAWRHGLRRLRGFSAVRTAREVEAANSGMDSLLVTAVHFQQHGASPGTSAAMWEHTQHLAARAAASVDARRVVSMAELRRPLQIAMAFAAVLLLGALLHGALLIAGLGRLFTPWRDIAYPTKTKIHLPGGEWVVKEGAPARVDFRLSEDVPKTAKLELQTGKGSTRELVLEVTKDACSYEIASASRDFRFRVKAGDARSDWRQVRVIPAPRLTQARLELDFPDYIDRTNEVVEALTLTLPEETRVSWRLTLDTPIRRATLHRDGAEDMPLTIGDDGRTLVLQETASASRGYSFSWTEDRHGFEFESPRYFLQVASDQPPRVELTSPENNLGALPGRPLPIAVRAQDDHGIGAATIIYRVNRRPEVILPLDPALRSGGGEQAVGWDYRKDIPDPQVGDTVSFLVEVADKYPGETGPHRARSESRRITFLSREDYLAEMTRQMDRLLNRVRSLYRQERAAHELLHGLDPAAASFVATCQMEAIRQEMVREQLIATAADVQTLLDDLAANQVQDAVESGALTASRDALRAIATNSVARAANLLRDQVGAKTRDPAPAITAVNDAARALSGLVMLRGIDASREVFALETHVIATDLARLRLRLLTAKPDQAAAVADDHDALAAWTVDLLDHLTSGIRYDKKPLSVLGLTRRIQGLRTAGVAEAMRKVATLAREGRTGEAAAAQYPAIRPLLECEFSMRAGSEYALVSTLRGQLALFITEQQALLEATSGEGFSQRAAELARRQAGLRDQLVLASLPGIPAAHARLDDLQLPAVPPCDDLRLKLESLMSEAVAHLHANAAAPAAARQGEGSAILKELGKILDRWSDELALRTIGASKMVSDATDRAGVLEQLENRQLLLLEQTENAALDAKNPGNLLEDQKSIAGDLQDFVRELSGGPSAPAKNLLPLLGRLESVDRALKVASEALQTNKVEDALEPQEKAAAALTEARGIAQAQLSNLNLLQQLIGFEQAVATAGTGMADIVGTQRDLIEATKSSDKTTLAALIAPQRNLHRCLADIAPSLDLVAERLDVGTPLVFAASDLEDALVAMEDGDAEDAADTQSIALDSLAKVQALVSAISAQTGYVVENVEFLQEAQAEAATLAYRQRQLREDPGVANALALQQSLAAETAAYGRRLTEVAGRVDPAKLDEAVKEKLGGANLTLDFNIPAVHMEEGVRLLQGGQAAADVMLAAEQSLESSGNQIAVIVGMLAGLPSLPLVKESPPELKRLISVLDVATKHRGLLRRTKAADARELTGIAPQQQKLSQSLAQAAPAELDHPLLAAAREQLEKSSKALSAGGTEEALRAQLLADQRLRHFIIEQSLVLNTAPVPTASSDADVVTESETDDLYLTEAVGFVADFVSGETPKDKKTEWEFLGTRNRAALNQNFARELPLEFRATLKNYYERVAK